MRDIVCVCVCVCEREREREREREFGSSRQLKGLGSSRMVWSQLGFSLLLHIYI
jgi:hypothetical protein